MTKHYYRNILKNVRKIVKCGICGHKQRIEFHHIKPTRVNGEGRGSAVRAWDIIKHPDCYIPLCYFCHQKVTLDEMRIIHNPISDYLGWLYSERLHTGWQETELVKLNVI